MWIIYANPRNTIARLITNPITPIKAKPIADTFATVVNSSLSGLFKSCQTLLDCFINDFKLNTIKITRLKGLKIFRF